MADSLTSSDTVTASVGTRWNFVPIHVWALNGLIMLGAYLTYQMWGTVTLVSIGLFAIFGAVVGILACKGLGKGAVFAGMGAIAIACVGAGIGAIITVGLTMSTNLFLLILVVTIVCVVILICWPTPKIKKWKWSKLIQIGIILCLVVTSFAVPQGTIHSGRYMPDWTLVNPFNMSTPLVRAPSFKGTILVNRVPEDWTINVKYHISDPKEVTKREWLALGIYSPESFRIKSGSFLDKNGDPKKTVEGWLNKFFPNVSITAIVTWTPPAPKTRVWK